MKKRIIGNAVIFHADAREVISALQEKAHLVVSDPPYKLTSGGKNKTGPSGGWMGEYKNDGAVVACNIEWPEIMQLLHTALNDEAQAYVMTNNRNVQAMLNAASSAGFEFHNLLVWDKITATANRWYMKNCEFTGFFYKGHARQINDCSCKQLIRAPQNDESGKFTANGKSHPTEKPISLMRHYIENSTRKGEIVIDPFCGTGTTGVAALESGRRFIGVEFEEEWFEVACRRIQAANQQNRLF